MRDLWNIGRMCFFFLTNGSHKTAVSKFQCDRPEQPQVEFKAGPWCAPALAIFLWCCIFLTSDCCAGAGTTPSLPFPSLSCPTPKLHLRPLALQPIFNVCGLFVANPWKDTQLSLTDLAQQAEVCMCGIPMYKQPASLQFFYPLCASR